MTESSSNPDREASALEEVLAEYLRGIANGAPMDRQRLMEEHPDLADELRSFFKNRDAIERLAAPLLSQGAETLDQSSHESPLDKPLEYFGDFRLQEELGRGGMGAVYRALQTSLNRNVALKMILSGRFASIDEIQRFRTEAEAAANLNHPNIVSIFEIGEHEGHHYFSMQLIEGESLQDQMAVLRGDLRRAAKLLAAVARAVHYAHQCGVLHRDLKPANILLDEAGHPFVSDFGLAKRVEGGSDLTRTGVIVGTPSYMAPEQACGEKMLTTAVDVYSLGAILYELLAGSPPFIGDTPVQTLLNVMTREPKAPSGTTRCDRDLETICLKCLEREPEKRYDSASALADDLERWLRGEAIVARPTTSGERIIKWMRRNPMLGSLAGIASIAIVVSLISLTYAYWAVQDKADIALMARTKAERSAQQANELRQDAERQLYGAQILLAQSALERQQSGQASLALDRAAPQWRGWEHWYLKNTVDSSVRQLAIKDYGMDLRFSADGKSLFHAGTDTGARIDLESNHTEPTYERMSTGYARVLGAPAPNIAIHGAGTAVAFQNQESLYLWDFKSPPSPLKSAKDPPEVERTTATMMAVAFSQDQQRVYRAGGSELACWAVDSGQLIWTMDFPTRHSWALAISPNEKYAAVDVDAGTLAIVDLEKREILGHSQPNRNHGGLVQFSKDNRRLIIQANRSAPIIYAIPMMKQVAQVDVQGAAVTALSPDTSWGATGTQHGDVVVWDAQTGETLTTLRGHRQWVHAIAISHDGKRIATTGRDEAVLLWAIQREGGRTTARLARRLLGHEDTVLGLAFDPTDHWLASGGAPNDGIRLWDVSRAVNPFHVPVRSGQVRDIKLFADQRRAAIAGYWRMGGQLEGWAEVWDLRQGKKLCEVGPQGVEIGAVAISPDNDQIACVSDDGAICVYGSESGKVIQQIRPPQSPTSNRRQPASKARLTAVAWHPQGDLLIVGGLKGELSAFDVGTGAQIWTQQRTIDVKRSSRPNPEVYPMNVDALAFTADGKHVCCYSTFGSFDAMLTIHRCADGSTEYTSPNLAAANGWAIDRQASQIAICHENQLQLLNLREVGRETFSTRTWIQKKDDELLDVTAMAFAPSCRELAIAHKSGLIEVYSLNGSEGGSANGDPLERKPIAVMEGHESRVSSLVYLDDGSRLVSGSYDHSVKFWAPTTGDEMLSLPMGDASDERVNHVRTAGEIVVATNGFPRSGAGDFNTIVVWNAAGFRQ